jgi:hypothetical protein
MVSNLRIFVAMFRLQMTTGRNVFFDECETTLLERSSNLCVPRDHNDFRRGACFDRRSGGSRSLGIGISS